MKENVMPKCPYCHAELKPHNIFNNPLSNLFGDYCCSTVKVRCQNCNNEYFVSKQTRYIARKKRSVNRNDY